MKVKKVKSLQDTWKLFKSTIMKADIERMFQTWKDITKSKRVVNECIQRNRKRLEGFFQTVFCPNDLNKKQHRF